MHNLGWFTYTKTCNKKYDMLHQGKRILFCRKLGNKNIRGMGDIICTFRTKSKTIRSKYQSTR